MREREAKRLCLGMEWGPMVMVVALDPQCSQSLSEDVLCFVHKLYRHPVLTDGHDTVETVWRVLLEIRNFQPADLSESLKHHGIRQSSRVFALCSRGTHGVLRFQ